MEFTNDQPVYMKIYHLIANDISIGVYKNGDTIPTQIELARRYSVSRATISAAIKELTRRKIIRTQRGKGTFVIAQPMGIEEIERFEGFSAFQLRHTERDMHSKLISVKLVTAPRKAAWKLGVPEDTLVWCICRVRYIDGRPIFHETSYILKDYLNGIDLAAENLENGSLYRVLREKADIEFNYSVDKIRAIQCPDEIALQLEISTNEPVLSIARVSGTSASQLIEYVEIVERSDISYTIIQSSRGEARSGTTDSASHLAISERGKKIYAGFMCEYLAGRIYDIPCLEEELELQKEFVRQLLAENSDRRIMTVLNSVCTPSKLKPIQLLALLVPAAWGIKEFGVLESQVRQLYDMLFSAPRTTEAALAYLHILEAASRPGASLGELEKLAASEKILKPRLEFAIMLIEKTGHYVKAIEKYFAIVGEQESPEVLLPLILGLFLKTGEPCHQFIQKSRSAFSSHYGLLLYSALAGTFAPKQALSPEDMAVLQKNTIQSMAERLAQNE